jgi:hypothetical protein
MEQEILKDKSIAPNMFFMLLIAIMTIAFVVAIVILIKDRDLISKDPIVYGINEYNFTGCYCYSADGVYEFNSTVGKYMSGGVIP